MSKVLKREGLIPGFEKKGGKGRGRTVETKGARTAAAGRERIPNHRVPPGLISGQERIRRCRAGAVFPLWRSPLMFYSVRVIERGGKRIVPDPTT